MRFIHGVPIRYRVGLGFALLLVMIAAGGGLASLRLFHDARQSRALAEALVEVANGAGTIL